MPAPGNTTQNPEQIEEQPVRVPPQNNLIIKELVTSLVNRTNEIDEQPKRELTQNDFINKKLLTSLFNRMNEGGDTTLSKMLESDTHTEDEEEWK